MAFCNYIGGADVSSAVARESALAPVLIEADNDWLNKEKKKEKG